MTAMKRFCLRSKFWIIDDSNRSERKKKKKRNESASIAKPNFSSDLVFEASSDFNNNTK